MDRFQAIIKPENLQDVPLNDVVLTSLFHLSLYPVVMPPTESTLIEQIKQYLPGDAIAQAA
jgi:hypothetical protein